MADNAPIVSLSDKNQAPVDTSVVIPESVRRAAAAADTLHAQVYQTTPAPATEPQVQPQPAPPAPEPQVQPQPAPPAPEPQVQSQSQPAPGPEEWEHRYLSMKGRFDQAQTTIGSMQEQMSELGNELVRTQHILNARGQVTLQPPPPKPLVTDEDVKNFGPEILDLINRAAKQAVEPELTAIEQQSQQAREDALRVARTGMYTQIGSAMPAWREVNMNPRFVEWLRLPDLYSGRIRQQLLNEAVQAANAPRVLAFFQGFVADELATGQVGSVPQPQPRPNEPAIPLATLAAPGTARPATGNTQVPVEKPIYTHNQIAQFYNRVRQGYYNGRTADKDREEAEIFLAQREGRVR